MTQILGAIAAVAGWVAVVGGAREWASLHNAGIPSTQTLAVLPRQLLIVEGLQTLLVPLLVGGGVALLVYYSWSSEKTATVEDRRELVQDERRLNEEHTAEKREKAKQRRAAKDRKKDPPRAAETGEAPRAAETGEAPQAAETGEKSRTESETSKEKQPTSTGLLGPILLLRNLIRSADHIVVVAAAAAFAVVVAILMLAILSVDWWYPAGAVAVGVVAALVAAYAKDSAIKTAGLVVAIAAPILGVFVAVVVRVQVGYALGIALLTLATIWLTLGAMLNRSRRGVAITLFVALLLWAGALGFLGDLGSRDPRLDTAVVMLKGAPPLVGFYLGGAGGNIYIASEIRPRNVTVVQKDDVAMLSFGQPVRVNPKPRSSKKRSGQEAGGGETPGTLHTQPAPTPNPATQNVVATALGTLDGVPAELDIMQPQLGKRLMVLNFRLTNTGSGGNGVPSDLVIGSLLSDGTASGRDTVDGVTVIDLVGGKSHRVAHDIQGHCLCSSQLSQVELAPGQSVTLYATFAPLPRNETFDLQINGFESVSIDSG